jgi:hypothetical protein
MITVSGDFMAIAVEAVPGTTPESLLQQNRTVRTLSA